MPEYVASDGKVFGNPFQLRKYEMSLQDGSNDTAKRGKSDVDNAPGGDEHVSAIRDHGVIVSSTIKQDGNGRWRHTATHADGFESTSVHPQWFRAQEVQSHFFDPDGEPRALKTHQRGRSHPSGPKEQERLDKEDGRVTDDEEE